MTAHITSYFVDVGPVYSEMMQTFNGFLLTVLINTVQAFNKWSLIGP